MVDCNKINAASSTEVEEVSKLLGCSSSVLTKALTQRIVNTGRDKVKADLSSTEVCL